jgi:hypothetical protein
MSEPKLPTILTAEPSTEAVRVCRWTVIETILAIPMLCASFTRLSSMAVFTAIIIDPDAVLGKPFALLEEEIGASKELTHLYGMVCGHAKKLLERIASGTPPELALPDYIAAIDHDFLPRGTGIKILRWRVEELIMPLATNTLVAATQMGPRPGQIQEK